MLQYMKHGDCRAASRSKRRRVEQTAHRWQTVLLLDEGVPYVEIAARVPTSTATVTRVAQWLRHGTGGYRIALERTRRRERRQR